MIDHLTLTGHASPFQWFPTSVIPAGGAPMATKYSSIAEAILASLEWPTMHVVQGRGVNDPGKTDGAKALQATEGLVILTDRSTVW